MNVYNELFQTIINRRTEKQEGSYTCYLFEKGLDKILKKCGEECSEMIIAAKNNDNSELKNEISDLLYHIMVMCVNQNLDWSEIEDVLRERAGKIGNLKKIKITDRNS